MRIWLFQFAIIAAGCTGAWAQSPSSERAPQAAPMPASLEWESHTRLEYNQAADYWKAQTEANRLNEEAWLQYYKAKRANFLLADGAIPNKKNQQILDEIIGHMANAVPTGFAFNYSNYVNGNRSDESFQYLKAALQLRPGATDLWDDMLCDAVLTEDDASLKKWVQKINEARLFSWAEIEYNRNVLNSVEQNGILITNGNVDTSPLYMLQSEGFRTDVIIVCLDWLGSNRYKHLLDAKLKIKPGVVRTNDRSGTFAGLMNLAKTRAVYTSLTVPKSLMQDYTSQLYCTGLALKYSAQAINNVLSLVYNWESLFQKNYWESNEAITCNYIVPANLLLGYYEQKGDQIKAAEIKQFIARKKAIAIPPYTQR